MRRRSKAAAYYDSKHMDGHSLAAQFFGHKMGGKLAFDFRLAIEEAFTTGRESMREEAASILDGIANMCSKATDIGADHSERYRYERIAARIRAIPTNPEDERSDT